MKITKLWLVALLALSGCAATAGTSKPPPATSANLPVVKGMAGGLAGTSVGRDLSTADKRSALEAEYRALEYTPGGQSVAWRGAGSSGQVTPAQPYRVGSQDCRQYTHTIAAGGDSQSARGTACRNTDGSWTPLT